MSVLKGGIFSNPSGKTGGVVFGAARTRTGKKVTSRLLVPPSNPNTAAQQSQRSKFSQALAIVRLLGSTIYQSDWNRAIGQLPGFQSMMNVFLNSLDASFELNTIPSINLGSLHVPDSVVFSKGQNQGELSVDYSTELGINGTANDIVVFICIENAPAASPLERDVQVLATKKRSETQALITGLSFTTTYSCLAYLRGAGTADGLLSATTYGEQTTL